MQNAWRWIPCMTDKLLLFEERSILLEEVAAEGIRPWDLLKGISKEIKKKKEKVKGYRYFGNLGSMKK